MQHKNTRYGREYDEHTSTEKHRSYRESYEHSERVTQILLWGIVLCLFFFLLGFLLWIAGTIGKIVDIAAGIIALCILGFFIYVWLAHHYYKMKRARIHARVIETEHVSVYAHSPREIRRGAQPFTNFSAQVAQAQLLPLPKDEPQELEMPRRDTEQEHRDRQVYNSKIKQKMTWPQVQEEYDLSPQEARSAKNRHEGRLQRGETIDTGYYY